MLTSENTARLDPDHRRDQILQVAARHFSRDGREAVSVSEIAREAGVTRSLIYHYFPGKDALLDAVLRRESEKLLIETDPDPALDADANLRRAITIYFDHFAASGGRLRGIYAPPPGAPAILHELANANHRIQAQRLLRLLDLSDGPATRLAIKAWLGFVRDAAREAVDSGEVSREQVIDLCLAVLHAAAGAITPFDTAGAERPSPAPEQEVAS